MHIRPGARTQVRPHDLRTHRGGLALESRAVVGLHVGVGNHGVQVQLGCVLAQKLQVGCRGKPHGLLVVGEVHDHASARLRANNRLALGVQQQVRQNRGAPRAGAEHNPVGFLNSGERLRAGTRVLRGQANIVHALLLGEVHLPHDLDPLDSATGVLAQHGTVNHHGVQRHGEHAAAGVQQGARPVQAGHRVVQQLPERRDEQVAERVVVQGKLPLVAFGRGETVLHDVAPGAAPIGVVAERRERHAQISGRKNTHLLTQAPRGAAVVRHGYHGRQVGGHVAQSRKGSVQAVPAAHGRHLR